jgi:type VI secretion system secreted protein VgrG
MARRTRTARAGSASPRSGRGTGWGCMHIPRIGQEVIVEFMEGDPDRPIITGRVYNGENMPPYELAKEQSISTIMSRSTTNGDSRTFNELRFQDKADEEEIYLHAERDFRRVVENDDILKVGFDKQDKGDQTIEIHNNRTRTVAEGNDKLQIKRGHRDVIVDEGHDTHHIKQGNREVKIDTKNDLLTVGQGDQVIKIQMGKSSTEAATAIELTVGASSIIIEPAQITIRSPQIKLQGDGKIDASAPMTMVSGDGMLTLKGGMVGSTDTGMA